MKNNIDKYSCLTPREKETLKFIIKGYTNEQMSKELNVSFQTIRTHRNRIWKKLDIKQFTDCLKYGSFFN
jgi:ATP/maltotriose-dependent transcriptional regulator MalT